MLADYAKSPRDEYPFTDFKVGLFIMLAAVLIIITLIFSVYTSAKDLYMWAISPKFGAYQTAFITGLMATLIAYSLFIFRLHRRMLYGITELLAGLMVVEHHAMSMLESQVLNPTIFLAMFTAGIYLMVRGLDNIHLGRSENETISAQLKKDFQGENRDTPQKND